MKVIQDKFTVSCFNVLYLLIFVIYIKTHTVIMTCRLVILPYVLFRKHGNLKFEIWNFSIWALQDIAVDIISICIFKYFKLIQLFPQLNYTDLPCKFLSKVMVDESVSIRSWEHPKDPVVHQQRLDGSHYGGSGVGLW